MSGDKSIGLDQLLAPRNRCLIARKDEVLNDVVARLTDVDGQNWWHLIVDWGNGEFRVTRFAELAERLQERPSRILDPLSAFELPIAATVDRFSTNTAGALDLLSRQPDGLLVVTEGGHPLGLLAQSRRSSGDAPPIRNYYINIQQQVTTLDGQGKVIGVEIHGEHDVQIQGGSPLTLMDRHPSRFEAYPLLDAPRQVEPEQLFTVTVGFSPEPDSELAEQSPIRIDNLTAGESLLVVLIGDGAHVLDNPLRPLSAALDARASFLCKASPGADSVTMQAHYICRSQIVGMAKRTIHIAQTGKSIPVAAAKANLCRLSLPPADSRIDLQVNIAQTSDQHLHWTLLAQEPPLHIGPIETEFDNAREFAARLVDNLKTQAYRGEWAARALESMSQRIADHMPAEFFDALRKVAIAVQRPPRVLLLTNEPYILWELALIDPPLDPNAPLFLEAQTIIGRWLLDEAVICPPPAQLELSLLSAVAATYGLDTKGIEDSAAVMEREALRTLFGATTVDATLSELGPLVGRKSAGHFIHFAAHSLSDPKAKEDILWLAEGNALDPDALVGRYRCGQVPAFAFVFLNACQLGMGAQPLGQAAGFPEALARGGVLGFIAPFWEVNDEDARQFAVSFYEQTLQQNGLTVAEFVYRQRQLYDRSGSLTPLAYVYYGHPSLRLHRST